MSWVRVVVESPKVGDSIGNVWASLLETEAVVTQCSPNNSGATPVSVDRWLKIIFKVSSSILTCGQMVKDQETSMCPQVT